VLHIKTICYFVVTIFLFIFDKVYYKEDKLMVDYIIIFLDC